ncbi:hypothetical protein B0H65DRAFT_436745 [Neurospora tetraspora]|uniref:Uncharacterized protein n=1 Tax=Neurospora tetraspora TaxID=94610 RepID=A0AAE0J0G2_9PEZI|nr:hypothetical protein B0H65DRAFT_436745 [Neurospora tetraspora]
MPSPSNSPRRSQSPDNQPPSPRLQREDSTVGAPGAPAERDEARLTAIANRVLGAFDPNDFFGSMATAFERMRDASGGDPATFRAIGRHAIAEINRRRNPEDGILDPAPPYTALPKEGEVTVELSVVEPEYTPRYTRYPQGRKRKREEDDNEEDDEKGEDEEEEQNHEEQGNEEEDNEEEDKEEENDSD